MQEVGRSLTIIAAYFICWQFAELFEVERNVSALYPAAGVLLICIRSWGWKYLGAAVVAMLVANWPQEPLPTWTGSNWWHLIRQLVVYGGAGLVARKYALLELPLRSRRGTANLIFLALASTALSALWALPIFWHYLPATRDGSTQLFFSFFIGDFGGLLFLAGGISAAIHLRGRRLTRVDHQHAEEWRDLAYVAAAMLSILVLVWILGTHNLLNGFSYLVLLPVVAVASARGLAVGLVVALFGDVATIFMYRGLDLPHIPVQNFQTLCTMVMMIAMIIGAAVDDEKSARFEAWHDTLTGLLNRRAFEAQATAMLERARHLSQDVAVISFDIDHFKQINDAYGHDSGDRVLAAFAKGCAQILRSTDLMARVGGEEFVVMLENSNTRDALATAQRLRGRAKLVKRGDSDQPLTASFGLYLVPCDTALDLPSILKRSDKALYEAKNTGRDRVVTCEGADFAAFGDE